MILRNRAAAFVALAALTLIVEPAAAQPYQGYGPPPPYGGYDQQYDAWAAQNCARQHSSNIAAGAIVGGVAGALLGASLAGWAARGAWALFGGSVGLAAGAAIGASSSGPGCPHGYALRAGAPTFAYRQPAYAPYAYDERPSAEYAQYGASARGDWTWDGYRWVRRSYGYPPPAYGETADYAGWRDGWAWDGYRWVRRSYGYPPPPAYGYAGPAAYGYPSY